jgi:hypothetical protein
MPYLISFAPWIVFAAVPAWQWAALAALLTSVGLIVRRTRSGDALDAQILEISSGLFFAVVALFAFAEPDSALRHDTGAASSGWFALTAWATIAVRKPFTLGIARRSTPREFWEHPYFYRVNAVITTVWAVCFTLTAAALVAVRGTGGGSTANIVVQVAGIVIPTVFTMRYQAYAKARGAAALAG